MNKQPTIDWVASGDNKHIKHGVKKYKEQLKNPNKFSSTVKFTEVTLRDGQQQQINEVTEQQRIEVFDCIVATGIDRVEIGHLGNETDQNFARSLVRHIATKEAQKDEAYSGVKLQVLFGSQQDIMQDGIDVLREAFKESYGENWLEEMSQRVVVHVYDRVDENLRNTATVPYSAEESADRVCRAAQHAVNAGFKQFSVSGEAATAESVDDAVQYYRYVNDYLFAAGAQNVNNNLANTYGFSRFSEWNAHTLSVFNNAVKHGYGGNVTTSVHSHNDVVSAVDFSIAAIVAGFDRVEGTMFGMGERSGNASLVDIEAKFAEAGRQEVEFAKKRGKISGKIAKHILQRTIKLDKKIVDNLYKTYEVCEKLAEIYGDEAKARWHKTAPGNPHAFDNGSGPHDQAMARAIEDPVKYPPYKNYEWFLAVASILGSKIADKLAIGDPDAVKQVTVNNDASGGKTERIISGSINRSSERAARAAKIYKKYIKNINKKMLEGVIFGY